MYSYKKLYTDVNHFVVTDKSLAFKGTENDRQIILHHYQYNLNHFYLNCDIVMIIINLLKNDLISLFKLYCTSKMFHKFINQMNKICLYQSLNCSIMFHQLKDICIKNQDYTHSYPLNNFLKYKNNYYKNVIQLIKSNPIQTIQFFDCYFNKKNLNKVVKTINNNNHINDLYFQYHHSHPHYWFHSIIIFDLLLNKNIKDLTFINIAFTDVILYDLIELYWYDELIAEIYLDRYLLGPPDHYFTKKNYKKCYIKNIKLELCHLDNYFFIRLMMFLCHTKVEYINVSYNYITQDYGDIVFKCLKLFKKLKFLHLTGNRISQQQINKWQKANKHIKIII